MIYYTYRMTEDWKNKKDFQYKWGSDKYYENNVNFIKLWGQIFDITWYDFRGKIKELSIKNFKRLDLPFIDNKDWRSLHDDDWLIFIDDDDALSPKMIETLNNINDNVGFVYGDAAIANLVHASTMVEVKPSDILSCGYAFKIKYIRNLNQKAIIDIFQHHWFLRKQVMNNNIPYLYVNEILSCYLTTQGSVCQMANKQNLDNFRNNRVLQYSGRINPYPDHLKVFELFLNDCFDLIEETNRSKKDTFKWA